MSGAGLQVSLECDGPSFILGLYGDYELPRFELDRVGGIAPIVFLETAGKVAGQADVPLVREADASQEVDGAQGYGPPSPRNCI